MAASPAPAHRFSRIPLLIQGYDQWIVWKYEHRPGVDKPTKVPYNPKNGFPASVTNSSHWGTFDQAVRTCLNGGYDGIGFVFTPNDPFTFIDLDDATHDEKLMRMHQQIIDAFKTYAERSPSGKGVHIICLGSIEEGKRSASNAAEIYDSGRYATFTGDRINEYDITEQQHFVDMLFKTIHNSKSAPKLVVDNTKRAFIDKPQTLSDEDVVARALRAKNGELFADLYNWEWQKHARYQNANGTPNWSTADQAFFNFLFFHSGNAEQMVRIWRSVPLGQRSKSLRQNYVMPMIENSADMSVAVAPEVLAIPEDFQALIWAQEAAQRQMTPEDTDTLSGVRLAEAKPCQVSEAIHGTPAMAVPDEPGHGAEPQLASRNTAGGTVKSTPDFLLKPPPGLLGEVAACIYQASSRPVPHIALAAAIGFMAGICGRAFNVSRPATGLNQYVLLLAETGRGKEAMKAGINLIVNSMMMTNPTADKIKGPGKINSGQALRPYLENNKCFVTIQSEFDTTYSQMVSQTANTAMKALKQELLDLYMASGVNASAEVSIYSDEKKNVAAIRSPAMTLLAECTIESMNAILDERQVKDGLLTRFINIVYDGPRVDKNEHPLEMPPHDMIKRLCQLHAVTEQNGNVNKVIQIETSPEATALLNAFDKLADAKINDASASTFANLWNRAHLKALKLAALLAASDYAQTWSHTITAEQAEWAISLVKHDIENVIGRFTNHEVGNQANESAQMRDIKRTICKVQKDVPTFDDERLKIYAIPPSFKLNRIVPYSYLTVLLRALGSFKAAQKPRQAIIDSVKELEEAGVIYDITRDPACYEKYGTKAKGFLILRPEYFTGT